MHRKRRYIAYCVLALIDVVLLIGSYLAACALYLDTLRTLGGLILLFKPADPLATFVLMGLVAFLIAVAYAVSSVYGYTYIGRLKPVFARVFAVNTLALAVISALLYVFHMDDVSRMTLFIFYVISTVTICLKCWVSYRIFLAIRKNKRRIQRTVVIGDGDLAAKYARNIVSNSTRLEQPVGFVSVFGLSHGSAAPELGEYLGPAVDLDRILSELEVDKIVIALEPEDYSYVGQVMAAADKYGLDLELVPFYSDLIPRRPEMDSVGDVRILNMRSMPLSNPLNSALKRGVDILVSGSIIVLFSWLYVAVAIGVKASSPGPVFFKQARTGKGNKPFEMLKFRSMSMAEGEVSTFTEDKEARKTRFGSFIRKFSIDEMPQFFNVFVGQMSIIGPRPVVEEETVVYRENIPRYMLRNQVRPGVSGWAQIHGYRGGTEMNDIIKRTEYDLWYIDHWTPGLDARIFFQTLFGGFVNSEKLTK